MSYKTLLVEKNKSIATISFNRPQKLNAFDKEMVLESQDIIESVTHDDAIKVVIITGIGKGFSAGADLSDPSGMDDHSNDRLVYEGLG